MKDFIKWLGVNEKIAKVAVWMLIFMVFLILTNTMLESMGFPHYAITYDNLIKVKTNLVLETIVSALVAGLNFYTIILLVFRAKEAKNIFKYCVLYCILNFLVNEIFGYTTLQILIVVFCTTFCYFYSKKNWKYIFYGIGSIIANIIIQGIWYITKIQFIDYTQINRLTKTLLSFDFFIIMAVIILVKEIYLKKRGEK